MKRLCGANMVVCEMKGIAHSEGCLCSVRDYAEITNARYSTAPEGFCLVLLCSQPDTIHRPPPR